jgi:hypothetical protein
MVKETVIAVTGLQGGYLEFSLLGLSLGYSVPTWTCSIVVAPALGERFLVAFEAAQ